MENGPFIDDFPSKTSIYNGFSIAMLNNQMVRQVDPSLVEWASEMSELLALPGWWNKNFESGWVPRWVHCHIMATYLAMVWPWFVPFIWGFTALLGMVYHWYRWFYHPLAPGFDSAGSGADADRSATASCARGLNGLVRTRAVERTLSGGHGHGERRQLGGCWNGCWELRPKNTMNWNLTGPKNVSKREIMATNRAWKCFKLLCVIHVSVMLNLKRQRTPCYKKGNLPTWCEARVGGRGSDPYNKIWATDASISDVKLCDCDLVLGFCFWRIYIIGGRIWRK